MIKKTGVIFFALTIGFSLLMHAVLPHHHHGRVPCFTLLEYCHSNAGHTDCCHHNVISHDCDWSHHQEDNQPGRDCSCVLEQLVITTENDQEKGIVPFAQSIKLYSGDFLTLMLPVFIPFEFTPPDLLSLFRQAPYLNNYHSVSPDSASGLRGPPCYLFS